MVKENISKQVSKGVRLKWASLKEVTVVKLSSDAIIGTRFNLSVKIVTRDLKSGQFVKKTTVRNRAYTSNSKFIVP